MKFPTILHKTYIKIHKEIKMKKEYAFPEIIITCFATKDIITSSGNPDELPDEPPDELPDETPDELYCVVD